jgi:hypothetical protein
MQTIKKKISTLVDKQLPEFISSEYPKFATFVKKYYEQLELVGQPLDIIQNLTKYNDIDTYEKGILSEFTTLSNNITAAATTINVADTYSFPETNGYALIDDEIIFYASKTPTSFVNCKRNLSGTTKLGDLYTKSTYKTVEFTNLTTGVEHLEGSSVSNVSNLFLYAFVKNFETQYLASFPEESLKPEVDKRTLIKNIKQFYRAKGTDQSIKFIFNSIVAQDANDIPSIYYPKDNTLKTSTSDWITKYALKVKIISSVNADDIVLAIGQKLIQEEDVYNDKVRNSFAIIDNINFLGNYDGDSIYEIALAPETVVGEFNLAQKTFLTKRLLPTATSNSRINVFSATGWKNTKGSVLIGNETFNFKDKTVNQFEIESRSGNGDYPINTQVYNYSAVSTVIDKNGVKQTIKFLTLGVLYNLNVSSEKPYSTEGDAVQISDVGFDTRNSVIYNKNTSSVRWLLNQNTSTSSIPGLSEILTDVAAIYEDEQYFYIASSGYPSYTVNNFTGISFKDQEYLKLIKKQSTKTTELYPTGTRDVGVFLNGVVAYGYKDFDKIFNAQNNLVENDIVYGGVVSITVNNKGKGYKSAPYVLISGDKGAKAKAILSGEVLDHIEIELGGTKFETDPVVTITSGRGAKVSAVVTRDKVTSLVVDNPGEYYSYPPNIVIRDSTTAGKLAEYTSIISTDGKLIGFNKINEGKFYTQENISVEVVAVGTEATASASTKRWKINRFEKLKTLLDSNNGYGFENIDRSFGYGYANLANPVGLRNQLGDTNSSQHSPILGFAYDGNPIYGPYGYSNAVNPSSSIKRMETSYRLKTQRDVGGPATSTYALGYFIEDYRYQHRFGDLDDNNGRYCVTPDYPEGVYAYFITINSTNIPQFPYIIGNRYYSIPVESNYTNKINYTNLPSVARRLKVVGMPKNGVNTQIVVESTKDGNISSSIVEDSHDKFSVGNSIIVDNDFTGGKEVEVDVSSLKGKTISSIESTQTKASLFLSKNPVYFFDKSIITQVGTNASGEVVGDIFSTNKFVLRNISGNFNQVGKLNSSIRILNLIIDTESFYTKGASIKLTSGKEVVVLSINSDILKLAYNPFVNGDGIVFPQTANGIVANTIYYVINSTTNSFKISTSVGGSAVSLQNISSYGVVATSEIASGEILETVNQGNTVKVKVLQGDFSINAAYYLKTSNIDDTVGGKIFKIDELSKNVEISSIDDNIALVTTLDPHRITENDKIVVDINPNDTTTTTNYYVRKRIYQTIKLLAPSFETTIDDTGIGVIKILNGGKDYANAGASTYSDVELIFADQSKCRNKNGIIVSTNAFIGSPGATGNAKATITVTNGTVSSTGVTITTKGSGYQIGDILTVSNSSLQRLSGSVSQQVLYLEVAHVGLGKDQTKLILSDVSKLSVNDVLQLDKELVRIDSILNNTATITRGIENTIRANHFTNSAVSIFSAQYNLTVGNRIGSTPADPIIISYDASTQILVVGFDLNQTLESIIPINFNRNFEDFSAPSKDVRIDSIISNPEYNFEFSKNNQTGPWLRNPNIEIQKYYKYKFITSDSSMAGSFLEFSPSSNKNIITTESTRGSDLPGSGSESTSFITLKFGFGDFSSVNTFTNKKNLDFVNYYYYDTAGIVNSRNNYLTIVDDPLQGEKTVNYVSKNSFTYSLNKIPEYDGSGNYNYTTSSNFAIGKIDKLKIVNSGRLYKKLPSIQGCRVATEFECIPEINWDEKNKRIISVSVFFPGSGYSNPEIFVDGNYSKKPEFDIVKGNNGEIVAILMKDSTITFKEKPLVYIIEKNIKAFLGSNNIGQPKNIKIEYNGSNFYNDTSISSVYTSHQILQISNFVDDCFLNGEIVRQYENNALIAEGKIASDGYKNKINIVKLINVVGEFKSGFNIVGQSKKNTASVDKVFYSIFSPEIKSYYNNAGYFDTDRGRISSANQKLADSYFHQDYSYVVKSKSPINIWKKLVEQTVHPAGFKLFGEVLIDAIASTQMPAKQNILSNVSILQLWDEKSNRVTIESTKQQLTQTVVQVRDTNIRKGKGSVLVSSIDTTETLSYQFSLQQAFDGVLNQSGNRVGTKTFNMILPGVGPLNVLNANNLIITLDGILQEPGKAFTVSGSSITFAQAPFGQRISNNQLIEPQKFVGRLIRFKNTNLNTQYFKKIKNIDNKFNGILNRFPLYYEDNTPAILDAKENLIVSLDGVLQENKVTPLIPSTSSYYIDRTKTPNEIVFVAAPTKLNEENRQKFFAYSVGNYERLELDERLFTGTRKGPFIMRTVFGQRTTAVETDRNILVFRETILQTRNRDYTITGSDIIFSEAPRPGQKINIIYLYGRETTPKLTFYNFENSKFFNVIDIVVNGSYSFKEISERPTIYQGNGVANWEAVGEVLQFSNTVGQTTTRFVIKQQNSLFVNNKDLKFSASNKTDYVIPASAIVSITPFKENDEKNDLVYKTKAGWLVGTELSPKYTNTLDVDDLVKIDGEKEYRKITVIPEVLNKLGHRPSDLIEDNHFGLVGVTEYNGVTKGDGLSVLATTTQGKVTSLSWNNRKYEEYAIRVTQGIILANPIPTRNVSVLLTIPNQVRLRNNTTIMVTNKNSSVIEYKGISIQPNAYGYQETPELVFVPQAPRDTYGNITGPVTGGGATGFVILDKGEVIDVVLTSSGSGYSTPPKVYITRGYKILKSPTKVITSTTDLFLSPQVTIGSTVTINRQIEIIRSPLDRPEIQNISEVKAKYDSTQPTIILTPSAKRVSIDNTYRNITSIVTLEAPEVITITKVEFARSVIITIPDIVVKTDIRKLLTVISDTGFVDIHDANIAAGKYDSNNLGNRFEVYENIKFMTDYGVADVSQQNTLEMWELYYPNLTIGDFADRGFSSVSTANDKWNTTWPTIQEHGAILDLPVSLTNTIVYIPNTSRFPTTGKLLIGDEIVTYSGKLSDRFTGCVRGADNTTIKSHNAGDYLRSLL